MLQVWKKKTGRWNFLNQSWPVLLKRKHTRNHFEWHNDKWLNSPELVSAFRDLWPYYWCGLKWLINYLTHASQIQKNTNWPLPSALCSGSMIFSHLCFSFPIQGTYGAYFYVALQYLVGHWDKTRSHTDRQTSPWRKQETLSSHFSLPGPRRDMKGVHFWCNFPSKG